MREQTGCQVSGPCPGLRGHVVSLEEKRTCEMVRPPRPRSLRGDVARQQHPAVPDVAKRKTVEGA